MRQRIKMLSTPSKIQGDTPMTASIRFNRPPDVGGSGGDRVDSVGPKRAAAIRGPARIRAALMVTCRQVLRLAEPFPIRHLSE